MSDSHLETTYVVATDRVIESIDVLLNHNAHPFFPAYMALRREAGNRSTAGELHISSLRPDWTALGDLLAVPGGPLGRPYLRPFWRGARENQQEWLNQNLAGSYSPSSLRRHQAQYLSVDSQGTYSLNSDHPLRALDALLGGTPLPAVPVAAFFLRNFGLSEPVDSGEGDLVSAFANLFGYRPEDREEFNILYDTAWTSDLPGPWIVPLDELTKEESDD